jgi:hypothetical protein
MRADCTASAACASVVPTYFIVEPIERCPTACFTKARFTLLATRWEQMECFKICGCFFSAGKPAASATDWKIRNSCVRSNRPPFCDVKRKSEPSAGRSLPPQIPQSRTTRLDVAAFLLVLGFQIARVDLEGVTAAFTFNDPDKRADSAMREFYNGGQVAASEYPGAQKRVRDLMWEAKRRDS